MCVCVYFLWTYAHLPKCLCKDRRATYWSWFSSSLWILGIERRLSGLAVNSLTRWAILQGLQFCFIQKRFSETWRDSSAVTSVYDSDRGPEFGFHLPGKSTHSCLWLKPWGSLTPSSGLFWHMHPQTHACTQTYIYMQLKIDTRLALWGLGLVPNSA